MRSTRLPCRTLLLCAVWLGSAVPFPVAQAQAACIVEAPAGRSGPFVKRLATGCTAAEREAQAVDSAAVLDAMANGRAIELAGVIIKGDLVLDRLPVQTVRTPKELTPVQREAMDRLNAEEIRSVVAPVVVRDAVVRGAVRHRSEKGTLQFEGPVDFRGTRFVQGVDLSRALFQHGMDLSGAQFEQEAYWVQGQFAEAVHCAGTTFGLHTRFHRAVFRGPVDCTGALFDGMAEFLETTFEQRAGFANVRFGSGTGFSGSRFLGRVSFAEAIFSREVFFPYVRFDADASFAGAQFLASADFSNAIFARPDDLSKARFDRPPLFASTRRIAPEHEAAEGTSRGVQFAVTLGLLVAAALLFAYAYKMK